MISSVDFEGIFIWDFHTGNLLDKIYHTNRLFGVCLWNEKYLFVCESDKLLLINLKKGGDIKELIKQELVSLKKIYIPEYGECLISHDLKKIDMWNNK